MIRILKNMFIYGSVFFLSCIYYEEFMEIEDSKLRVIGVRYEPFAEVAPGDTLTCKAYFAGDDVISIYGFSAAYKAVYEQNVFFPDEHEIQIIDSTLWLPDSIQFRFQISENFFLEKKELFSMDSTKIRKIVQLVKQDRKSNGLLFSNMSKDSLEIVLDDLRSLSYPGNLFFHARSRNNSVLKVRSQFVIRYNSLFKEHLVVNSNPEINWIAIYKVPVQYSDGFNPNNPELAGKFSTCYLFNRHEPERTADTIEIDTGYTYYLGANEEIDRYKKLSGEYLIDTTCDFVYYSGNDTAQENYSYVWFYQNLDNVSENSRDLLILDREKDAWYSIIELKPPVIVEMEHFKVWLVIYDYTNDQGWPTGYAIKEVKGVFKYTDAYKKSI